MIALLLEEYENIFDLEFMPAQEMRAQALQSGELEKSMSRYTMEKYGIEAEMTD